MKNKLGSDQHGNDWYEDTNADSSQTWAQVRNGKVKNGGVNITPKTYNPKTGLSSPTKR